MFAPDDNAFAELPASMVESLLKDIRKLKDILTYHVVAGKLMAADVASLTSIKTVQGKKVSIDTKDGVKVNAAVYARPYFTDEKTAVFIMAERLTHENVKSNPSAAYLFMEVGEGYTGKRLYLNKIKEEQNEKLVSDICRKCDYSYYNMSTSYVVYFNVEKILPLIGDGT